MEIYSSAVSSLRRLIQKAGMNLPTTLIHQMQSSESSKQGMSPEVQHFHYYSADFSGIPDKQLMNALPADAAAGIPTLVCPAIPTAVLTEVPAL
jgi:hypothetical protein